MDSPDPTPAPEPTPLSPPADSLLAARREKVAALRARELDPFGGRFATSGPDLAAVRAQFEEGKILRAAGRLTARRDFGKSLFVDLGDLSGRFQLYLNRKSLSPAQAEVLDRLDLGDFLGAEGECFLTKTGEPTLRVHQFVVLGKALRPPPEKWHGLADVETRYRQRYLDLVANARSREVFLARSRVLRAIREFLHERGFLEVETPMMQPVAGGAAARPFVTHHNALNSDFYLRIALELYLKRLLVGGFPKVFEIGRNFRNEGLSRRHNPEFTMLEAYWAYADFEQMAELVEEMICHLAALVASGDGSRVEHRDAEGHVVRVVNLQRPWRRARYHDLIRGVDPGWFGRDAAGRVARAAELGVETHPGMADHEVTQQIFEKLVEERTVDPLFVTHLPKELVPLAKQNATDPALVDVYELIINGQEISPGYSELNDPEVQRARLLAQAGEEVHKLDEDFLLALEHGMPPAGGIGVGIDRLLMLLTGAESIRDVILFPHLRPKDAPGS